MALATAERVEPRSTAWYRPNTILTLGIAVSALLAVVGCRSSSAPAHSEAALGDGEAVATVDGAEILGKAVVQRVEALRPTFSAPDGSASTLSLVSAQLRVVDEIVDERLAAAGASRAGVVVTDADVDARLAANPDPRPWARDAARAELQLERLAGAESAPPSDAVVEAHYRDYVAPEVLLGRDVPPLDAVREQLRAGLAETFRTAARDAARRHLRATIPHTNDLAARFAGVSWDGPATIAGTTEPAPSIYAAPLGIGR